MFFSVVLVATSEAPWLENMKCEMWGCLGDRDQKFIFVRRKIDLAFW